MDHGDNGLVNKKAGASNHYREFKSMIRDLVQHDHLSDYRVSVEHDMVMFENRMSVHHRRRKFGIRSLDREAYYDARLVAPSYDMYIVSRRGGTGASRAGSRNWASLARHSLLSVSRVLSDGQIRVTRICAGQ